ncbi:MAG: regulatory protein GemA [Desulfobulbaceae bacterium]|nr:regulatory protein GemA [Desulfobulbaceae bacterium]
MKPTRADYAKIHIAAKELGFDDEQYRNLLWDRFKVRSAKDLKPRQVGALLSHFRALGWRVKPGKAAKTKRQAATDPMSRKIRALWITMHQDGIVRDPSERALGAYIKRLTGVEALQWCDDNEKCLVIESLKKWQKRADEPR